MILTDLAEEFSLLSVDGFGPAPPEVEACFKELKTRLIRQWLQYLQRNKQFS